MVASDATIANVIKVFITEPPIIFVIAMHGCA